MRPKTSKVPGPDVISLPSNGRGTACRCAGGGKISSFFRAPRVGQICMCVCVCACVCVCVCSYLCRNGNQRALIVPLSWLTSQGILSLLSLSLSLCLRASMLMTSVSVLPISSAATSSKEILRINLEAANLNAFYFLYKSMEIIVETL